jgi:hypothetical protein
MAKMDVYDTSELENPTPGKQNRMIPLGNLWQKRGEDDVTYQRQAQLTWWTLMGGIAMGALLTQFDTLILEMRTGNWHYLLYFLSTCFVIVNSWTQTAWGALVLCWPISVASSLILFFGNLSCSIAALSITNPVRWYMSIGCVVLSAVLMQFHFKKQKGWITLPPEAIQRALVGIKGYIGLILVVIMICFLLIIFPGRRTEVIFGIIALVLSSTALYWQHLGMLREKEELNLV